MKIELFGIKFDNLSMGEVLEKVKDFLGDGKQHYIVLPYSGFVVRAQKDKEFKNVLNKADFCLCEGRGLWLMARLVGKKLKQNIYGIDLIYNICNAEYELQNTNYKIFLLGGKQDVVDKTRKKLGERVIGSEHGYQDLDKIIKKINQIKPDILLVALGSPKQEKFIYYNLSKMPSVKLAIGVGGAFDFISGRVKRAPEVLQKIGLEWLWRLILQPGRIKKTFNAVFGLAFLTFKNMLLLKRSLFAKKGK